MLKTQDSVRLNADEQGAFETFVGGEAPKSRKAYEAAVQGAVASLHAEADASLEAMNMGSTEDEKRDHAHNAACAKLLAAITQDSLAPLD